MLKYLGIYLTNSGNIRKDYEVYLKELRNNIYTKFTNYCAANYLAPLSIKLKVLNSCLLSTILYGCEGWGDVIPNGLEFM